MAIELITPEALPMTSTHHQLSIATGSRLVFIAGQVALDADGNRVGDGDAAAQVEQCYVNVAAALAEAGATFADVAKLTVYAIDLSPEGLRAFGDGIARACERLQISQPMAPLTGIGVAALADPEFLVEIEAIAVVDRTASTGESTTRRGRGWSWRRPSSSASRAEGVSDRVDDSAGPGSAHARSRRGR